MFGGCTERASDIVTTPSQPSQDFPVAGAYVEPAGSYSVERVPVLFDTTLTDAFGRGTGVMGTFNRDNDEDWGAYSLRDFGRNASTDPRLPALGDADAEVGGWCYFASPAMWGPEGVWDFYCEVVGLNPSTRYTAMMVRYSLTVNAELDVAAAALGEPITQPDQLTVLGSNPQGYPTTLCDYGTQTPVIRNANPFVLGYVDTDAGGEAVIDCIPESTAADPTWWRNDVDEFPTGVEDSIPFGPNTGLDAIDPALPSFNYIVLVEGQGDAVNPVPTGAAALRWQVANDINASNQGINNAIAPFSELIPADEISGAPGYLGARPDSLQVTFSNLEELTGGSVYQAWLVNPGTGGSAPATGTYYKIELVPIIDDVTGEIIGFSEDTVETVTGTSSFVGGDAAYGFLHSLVVSDATLGSGADSVGLNTHVTLTITSSPGSALPDARPFWFQYSDQNGTPPDYGDDSFFLDGPTLFGNFDAANPAGSRVYSGEGQGLGGVRAGELSVDVINVSRPPVGYYLAGFLVALDGTTFSLPEVTGPSPDYTSLVNADVEAVDPVVTATGILNANARVVEGEAGILIGDYFNFILSLEPKAGLPGLGPIPVQSGEIPEVVRQRAEPEDGS